MDKGKTRVTDPYRQGKPLGSLLFSAIFLRRLLPALFLFLGIPGLVLAAGPATQFAFQAGSSPVTGVYLLNGNHSVTFIVQAEDAGGNPTTFSGAVTAAFYDTSTGQPSDPNAVFVNSLGATFLASAPLTFSGGTLSFGATFGLGSNSEEVSLASPAITNGAFYPSSGGFVVQGFGQSFYVEPYNLSVVNFPVTTQLYVPSPSPTPPTDLLDNNFSDLQVGTDGAVTLPQGSGVTGSTGIDTAAAAFVTQGISAGYAFGGQGVSTNLWFNSPNAQPTTVLYQIILDYDGSLTDYNNPGPNDTVFQGAVSVFTAGFSHFPTSPSAFLTGPALKPFMANGQIIMRLWSPPGSAPAEMRYSNSVYQPTNFCFLNIPYSSQNTLPLKASLSPSTVLDGGSPSLKYVMQNQFSNPVSYVQIQVPEVAGNYWTINTQSSSLGSVVVTSQATSSAPGTLTLTMGGAGLAPSASVTLNLGVTAPATTMSNWSFPILNAVSSSGTGVLTDSSLATVSTLGVPDTPQNFTAVPINFTAPGTGGAVSLSWSQSVSENPQGYIITRSGGGFTPVTLVSPTTTNYTDSTAANLTGYTYSIVSYNAVVNSPTGNAGPVTAYVNPAAVAALTALTGGTTIQLNWSAAVSAGGSYALAGYQVWRDTQPSMATAVSLASVGNVTTYNDTTVSGGTQYYYELATLDGQYGGGAPNGPHISALSSAQGNGFPLGNPPNGMSVSLSSPVPPILTLTWTAPVDNLNSISNYVLFREVASGGFSAYATVGGGVFLVNDSLVTIGTIYSYYVEAVDSQGVTSNPSATVIGQAGPQSPAWVSQTATSSAITLIWTANPTNQSVVSYNVYANGGATPIGSSSTSLGYSGPVTYIDSAPVQGTNYVYTLAGVNNSSVTGAMSLPVTSALPPLVVNSFAATVQQTGVSFNVDLNWALPNSGGNVTAYNIRVNTTNNVVTAVPVTLGLPASYVQPYVVPQPLASAGATLFYFIRGLDPGGPGPVPATIALQLPPNPPTPVAASPSSSAVTISWTGNIPSEAVTFYTVYRSINPTSGFVSIGFTNSPATIYKDASAAAGTDYYYQVSATNPGGGTGIPGGESLLSKAVTTALLPPTPIGLTAQLNSLSDNVTLTWTSQSGSEPNLQNYILTRTINGGAPAVLQTAAGSVTSYVDTAITSANAGQTILYYLVATNDTGGSSAPEGPVGLQVPPTPPGAPTPNASSNSITLSWTPNGVGQNVSFYTVYRESLPSSSFVSIGTAAIPPFIDTGAVSGPLTNGGSYVYELTATNPGGGVGVPGGTSAYSVTSAPWGLAPAPPTGLAVSILDNLNDIAVTWASVTGDASVTGVNVLSATVNNYASAVSTNLAAVAVSQFYSAQTGDTTYYYWLQSLNPYGGSALTGPVTQLTYPATVNFAPPTLGPNQSTVLSWVTLGSDVTSYVESRAISGTGNFTQSQTITAAGLNLPVTLAIPYTAGKLYQYEITAINATGAGLGSNLQPFTYLPSVPVSVTALSGTSNTGVTVDLSWSDPAAANESVTGYTVYKATALAGPYSSIGSLAGTTYADSGAGVTATGVYYYIISAMDNLGQQSPVTATNAVAVTAFALPNPPGALVATAANGSVSLSWGPAVATTYAVSIYQIQRVGAGVTTVLTSTASSLVDSGVTNGVTYVYSIQTEDTQGNLSSVVGPATALPLAAPGAAQNVNVGLGDTELLLTWNAGTPGTLPIGTYQIYRSTAGAGGPFTLLTTVNGTTTGYLDSTLTDGSSYSYYMVSVDTSGVTTGLDVSSASTTVSGTPFVGAVNPPSNFVATAGVAQVVLTWNDSVTVGPSSAVTAYAIYQETGGAGFVSIGTQTPTGLTQAVTETGLTNGTLYSYYLVAEAGSGSPASSATVFGTPSAPPAAPTPFTGTDGNNQVTLNWGASAAQGSVTILDYYISRDIIAGAATTLTTTGPVTAYIDNTGISNGQTVVYLVGSINSNGTASTSLSGPVTDYPYAPFAPVINSHSAGTTSVILNFTPAASPSWGVTQFDILRTPLGGGTPATLTGLTSPVTDTTATQGTLYVYAMEGLDNKGHTSALSNAVTDGPSNPPAAPATLVVTAGSQQVLLDWPASAPVNGAIPVSFYIVTVNGLATTIYAPITSYLVNNNGVGLTDPAGVTVSIQAVDDSGTTVGNHASTVVGPVTVLTSQNALNPPTGLTAKAKSGTSVLLSWTPPNDEGRVITAFNIYRSGSFLTSVGSPLATVNNPALAPVTAYTDNSVGANATYYYVVKAVYSQPATATGPTASPNSNNAVVTTPAPAAGVPPVTVGVMAFDANVLKPLTGQKLGIYFVAPNSGPTELDVYNISGHPIRALYATAVSDTPVNLTWDGKDRNGMWAASGVYLIEIKAPGLHQIKKVIVVK